MIEIACFFTCGYTERDAMQVFIRKILPEEGFALRQYCPRKTQKRRRGVSREEDLIEDSLNGLSGDSLIKYVYQTLDTFYPDITNCAAVLIEDDLDGKFYRDTLPGDNTSRVSARTEDYEEYCEEIGRTVREKLKKDESFPVILLHAAPEVESWFLADWDGAFGTVYKRDGTLNASQNSYFSTRFRQYLRERVLCDYADSLENYGYVNGVYFKLSEQIIQALDEWKFNLNTEAASPLELSLSFLEKLRYSKRLNGPDMLKNINPETVLLKCPVYFGPALRDLRNIPSV